MAPARHEDALVQLTVTAHVCCDETLLHVTGLRVGNVWLVEKLPTNREGST
jgi:hypothetical protein